MPEEDGTVAVPVPPQQLRKVCVSGSIGAGKSTLSKALSVLREYELCVEPSDENEYLDDFYKDMSKYSFQCQIAFLAARFSQNAAVMKGLGADDGVVCDRSAFEDVIFARMLYEQGKMTRRDFSTYLRLFDTLVENIGSDIPDAIIYLDVAVDELMRRVKKRGRTCEKAGGVTREYLTQLNAQYERFVEEMGKRTCVYRVDWNTFHSTEDLWDKIEKIHTGMPGIVPVVL